MQTQDDTNVVQFPAPRTPSASDAVVILSRLQSAMHGMTLDIVAQRIDWLASGVSCWPDDLITRNHMLTQLRILADGVRKLRSPQPPTGGEA
jgi:hypothetical protein